MLASHALPPAAWGPVRSPAARLARPLLPTRRLSTLPRAILQAVGPRGSRQDAPTGGSGSACCRQRRRGRASHCQAAALPLFQLASAAEPPLYEPTGVPLVDQLMKLNTVEAAAGRSLRLLAFLALAALAGGLMLRAMDAAAGRRIREAGETRFRVGAAMVASAYRPFKVMLPLYCSARAATVVLALAEVASSKAWVDPAHLLTRLDGRLLSALQWGVLAAGVGNADALQMLPALQWLTQLVQDCSELVAVVAVAWTALNFKSRVIAWQARVIQLDSDPHNDGAVPLLRLLSSGLGAVIISIAVAVTLVGFGFHIGPLMASIGGLGVVIGLATQPLLVNLAAAVSLYMTRPFVTGDQVQLINPEGVEVEGVVLSIEPTRTILQDCASGCIIHINNSDVSEFIIKNYTQNGELNRLQELQAAGKLQGGASSALSLPELALAIRTIDYGAGYSSSRDSDAEEEASGAAGAASGQAADDQAERILSDQAQLHWQPGAA